MRVRTDLCVCVGLSIPYQNDENSSSCVYTRHDGRASYCVFDVYTHTLVFQHKSSGFAIYSMVGGCLDFHWTRYARTILLIFLLFIYVPLDK